MGVVGGVVYIGVDVDVGVGVGVGGEAEVEVEVGSAGVDVAVDVSAAVAAVATVAVTVAAVSFFFLVFDFVGVALADALSDTLSDFPVFISETVSVTVSTALATEKTLGFVGMAVVVVVGMRAYLLCPRVHTCGEHIDCGPQSSVRLNTRVSQGYPLVINLTLAREKRSYALKSIRRLPTVKNYLVPISEHLLWITLEERLDICRCHLICAYMCEYVWVY